MFMITTRLHMVRFASADVLMSFCYRHVYSRHAFAPPEGDLALASLRRAVIKQRQQQQQQQPQQHQQQQ